jgi:hypothetical protein
MIVARYFRGAGEAILHLSAAIVSRLIHVEKQLPFLIIYGDPRFCEYVKMPRQHKIRPQRNTRKTLDKKEQDHKIAADYIDV